MGMMQRIVDALTNRAVETDIAVRQALGPIVVPPYQMNKPIWTTGDPARYVDEGWSKAPVVFACVMAISDAAATAPIQVLEAQGEGEPAPANDTPLGVLMRRPNADLDGAEFVQVVTTIAALSGFCVIEKERDRIGNVIGLYPLRSDWLKPVPRQQSAPAWAYHIPGHRDPYILEPEDVIVHTHAPDPNLGYRGTSPAAVAFRELGIENLMTDFLKAFFDRGALPVYGIVPKQAIKDQAQADAFRAALMGKYGGALRSAEPMLLTGVEDVKKLGFDFNELAYPELRGLSEVQICTAFRVPPILIGIQKGLDAGTYSNYEQARRAFFEDTIASLWRRLDGALTRSLLPDFDTSGRLSIDFDRGEVPALQDDEDARWARATAALTAGGISRHVFQGLIGVEPHGSDSFLVPFSTVEVSAEAGQRSRASGKITSGGRRANFLDMPHEAEWIKALTGEEPPIVTRDGRLYLNERAQTPDEREQRARIVETHRGAILRLADLAEPAVSAYLAGQRDRLLADIEDDVRAELWMSDAEHRADDVAGMSRRAVESIDWDDEAEVLLRELAPWLDTVGEEAFALAATELSLDGSMWRVSNAYLRQLQELLGHRIVGITETTRSDLERIILESLTEGTSPADLAEKIRGLYSETYNGRSMTIARTESQVAFNTANTLAYDASGVVSRAILHDNASHTDGYGASDGLTCAGRNNLIVPLSLVSRHIAAEHPNGTLSVSPYVQPLEA